MEKINTLLAGVLVLLVIGLTSCDDVIAVNISDQAPVMIIPQENTISGNPTHFKWEAIDGATKYRLEVVTSSFSNITDFVIDSTITGTEIYLSLDSNQYQCRLTAMNAGYTSQTSAPITFLVGTSESSSQNSVTLVSPADNATLSSTDISFTWSTLANATKYTFEIHSGGSFADPLVGIADQLATVSYTMHDLTPGTYTWGVKAYFSDNSETVYSKRTFTIDTVAPTAPTLLSPSNNAVINSGSLTFKWNSHGETGITSLIEIATDQGFTSVVYNQETNIDSTTYTIQSPDVYYWRVTNTDQGGNAATSSIFTFTLF